MKLPFNPNISWIYLMTLNKTIFKLLLTELRKTHKECFLKQKQFFEEYIYNKI